MIQSISAIIASNSAARTIGAPNRPYLDGATLATIAETTRTALNAAGIGRNDRVAIVLPNGPEMAACFIAVAASCTAAPLNPAYKEEEFHFYLSDLGPAALILAQGDATPASAAAARLGIPVILLSPSDGSAGAFALDASALPPATARHPGSATPDDIALILHTSGTTARPKIVPLTNRNLAASAANIARLPRPHPRRHLPQRHAALPHPRPHRRRPPPPCAPAPPSAAPPASTPSSLRRPGCGDVRNPPGTPPSPPCTKPS